MELVKRMLDDLQSKLESRLREEGAKIYDDSEWYNPEETAEIAMNYITISGRERDITFNREKMVRQNNALPSIRNRASTVDSVLNYRP